MRCNAIQTIPEECFVSGMRIVQLNLEENQIGGLPDSLGNLKRLKFLRLTKNHLRFLPESIGSLGRLEELYVNHNYLEVLPDALSDATRLKTIDFSYNQLYDLSNVNFKKLTKLTNFRLNLNHLSGLPSSFATLPLIKLSICGNHLEVMPEVLLEISSLENLVLQGNKIFSLPSNFGKLKNLKQVDLEGNPMRSPTHVIVSEGILAIQLYLTWQALRMKEMQHVLRISELKFDRSMLSPTATGFLTSPSSFLTKEDVADFEKKVDQYLNKDFYARPHDKAVNIVLEFLQLDYDKSQIVRRAILDRFITYLSFIRNMKWMDKVDFRYGDENREKMDRPWGEGGAPEECFFIAPDTIFHDVMETNRIGIEKMILPSIDRVLKIRERRGFKDEVFPYTQDQVEDAISHYIGPYGPVGLVHDSTPFSCGCEEMLRRGKMHVPCLRRGYTLLQFLYTPEEAERKASEEDSVTQALKKITTELAAFLETEEGVKRLRLEVRKMRRDVRNDKVLWLTIVTTLMGRARLVQLICRFL